MRGGGSSVGIWSVSHEVCNLDYCVGLQSMLPNRRYSMLDVIKSHNIRCITLMCLTLW